MIRCVRPNAPDQKRVGLRGLDRHYLLPSSASGCYADIRDRSAIQAAIIHQGRPYDYVGKIDHSATRL